MCWSMLLSYLRNDIVCEKCDFPCFFSLRVRDPTGKTSYLVPEAHGGLQECDHHRLDIFLEKWHGPLCPHPQVQTPTDVRKTHPRLQSCIFPPKAGHHISVQYPLQTWTHLFVHSFLQLPVRKSISCGCVKYSWHASHSLICVYVFCCALYLLLTTCKRLFKRAERCENPSYIAVLYVKLAGSKGSKGAMYSSRINHGQIVWNKSHPFCLLIWSHGEKQYNVCWCLIVG